MEDERIVVFSGGGFKIPLTGGIACELLENEKFNDKKPSVIIGGSAGAWIGAGYVSGDSEFIEDALTNTISKKDMTKRFISWGWGKPSLKELISFAKKDKLKNLIPKKNLIDFFNTDEWKNSPKKDFINRLRFSKIIDIEYLIDEVFYNQKPRFNLESVYSSDVKLLIPALDTKTGKMLYFSNRDEFFANKYPKGLIEVIHGTSKLPLISGVSPKDVIKACATKIPYLRDFIDENSIREGLKAEVKVRRENGKYSTICDSLLTSSCWTHIGRALKEGAKKILVIDLDPYDKYKNPYDKSRKDAETRIFNFWFNRQDKYFQENYRKRERKAMEFFEKAVPKLEKDGVIYRISMPKGLTHTLANGEEKTRYVFSKGREFVREDKGLYEFWNS